ncbi:hypothetical protein [Pectobacterium versatile]|uniref:hypothetical protein n=1 Tax=Pectobacterium versatile TaxID=2488639 RepID=UPI0032F00B4C
MLMTIPALLKKTGPILSSKLCDLMCAEGTLTRETARQHISRAVKAKTVHCLKEMFPRREHFLYLPAQFGSSQYWSSLTGSLQATRSAYGYALGALSARGGVVPVRHFPAACGAPKHMRKRLSYDTVREELLKQDLVKIVTIPGCGECVALREKHDENLVAIRGEVRARLITESVLIKHVAQWIKNLGIGSYDKVRTRDNDLSAPEVTRFQFDISSPSYLSPILTLKKTGEIMPGFVACDVLLNGKLELIHVSPFINKCRSINSLSKTGRTLFIFVSENYTLEAFQALKNEGVIPATVDNLFGQDTADALIMLKDLLQWITNSDDIVNNIDNIMSRLSNIEGVLPQLQGDLFEYLVAQSQRDFGQVEIGKLCKDDNSKPADCDVLVKHGQRSVTFIECKGYKPYSEVLHKDVIHWMHDQVSVFYKHAIREYPGLQVKVELWTTGKLSFESKKAIDKFIQNNEIRNRYEIKIREADNVHDKFLETCDKSLIKVFERHFLDPIEKKDYRRPRPRKLATCFFPDDEPF